MADVDLKVRENRARRAAERQGLQVMKSRRRDENALDFGLYMIVDIYTDAIVHSSAPWGGYALTIDDVEEHLEIAS